MKCPLMVSGYRDRTLSPMRPATDCLLEACAWWDKRLGRCAILGCSHELANLADVLGQIRDRLSSHERLV